MTYPAITVARAASPDARRSHDPDLASDLHLKTSALLGHAARHYQGALASAPEALQYLRGRGISRESVRRFGLGFARPVWRDLHRVLRDHDAEVVDASGLVIRKDAQSGDLRFDRFRNRIMFPIRDAVGCVIAFGGRTLSDEECRYAKYMNSPASELFNKRGVVYGLYEARHAIARAGSALVVEGYLDVVQLAQHGFEHSVATMGTSCTGDHLVAVLANTNNVTFAFDGDAAGRRAAAAAMTAALPFATDHRQFRFAFLADGHDPDSLCRAEGASGFSAALARALGLAQMIISHAEADCDLAAAEGRARAAHIGGGCWAQLPDGVVADQVLKYFSALLQFSQGELLDLWNRVHVGGEDDVDADVDEDGDDSAPDLGRALAVLRSLVAGGVEYPEAHWQAARRCRLSADQADELQALYDQGDA